MEPRSSLRILHLSDTHGMHRSITSLPDADVLIHTGDFTDRGRNEEFSDFDQWLGEIGDRYKHILVIFGNHGMPITLSI